MDACTFVNLYKAADVREMDRHAMEECGFGNGKLMERAGTVAFGLLGSAWPWARRIAVVAGSGNNGGDGYVLARHALAQGLQVAVFAVREAKHDDAVRAAREYRDAGGLVEAFEGLAEFEPDIIVDALMGTGLDRPLEGDFAQAVEAMNAADAIRFSIDIPSGLNADTGAVMGCAIEAERTITFIGVKCGLLTGHGPAFIGCLDFFDLNMPERIHDGIEPAARRVAESDLSALLPARERDAHKGRFGHVLVLGGDYGTPGAVRMAAESALRAGAGLVSVCTQPEHVTTVVTARPELMCRAADGLGALVEKATVIAVGPGLGQGEFGRRLFAAALESGKPLVVDADGLNLLAAEPVERGNWILTPHPGEAGRLLGGAAADVQADRFDAAEKLGKRFNAIVVLKGAGTLVAAPGKMPAIIDRGNPGMASGGMGDILTGIIAAIQAQGCSAFDAARLGAFAHAVAGDRAAASGERGLAALDLVAELRGVVNS